MAVRKFVQVFLDTAREGAGDFLDTFEPELSMMVESPYEYAQEISRRGRMTTGYRTLIPQGFISPVAPCFDRHVICFNVVAEDFHALDDVIGCLRVRVTLFLPDLVQDIRERDHGIGGRSVYSGNEVAVDVLIGAARRHESEVRWVQTMQSDEVDVCDADLCRLSSGD